MSEIEAQYFNRIRKVVDPEGKMLSMGIIKLVEEKFTSNNAGSTKCLCADCSRLAVCVEADHIIKPDAKSLRAGV